MRSSAEAARAGGPVVLPRQDDDVERVLRLGGRSLDQRHDYDEGVVVVIADPEGNEFCLVQYCE